MPANESDVSLRDEGSLILFSPRTPEAFAWTQENVEVPNWAWLGNSFAVSHGYADALVAGYQEAGFTVDYC